MGFGSKPHIYGFGTQNNGCAKYRIWQPLKWVARNGQGIVRREKDRPQPISVDKANHIFKWADTVFMQPFNEVLAVSIMLAARDHHKKRLVVDLDDNVWAIHPLNVGSFKGKLTYIGSIFSGKFNDFWELVPASADYEPQMNETLIDIKGKPVILRQKSPDAKLAVELALKECDAVTTTNEALAAAIRKVTNKPIAVLPNCIDTLEWKPVVSQDTDEAQIGWCGSVSHYPDLEPLMKPLDSLMADHPNVKFQVMGSSFDYLFPLKPDAKKQSVQGSYDGGLVYAEYSETTERWPGRMSFHKPVPVQEYPGWMQENWRSQIGIAPIESNAFNDAKSELKWLEYTALGSVTVASKFGPYKRAMQHDEDGKLCGSLPAWRNGLEELIGNKDLRKRLVANARERLYGEYNAASQSWKYAEVLA